MIQFENCPYCHGPLKKCWCHVPGFVTYKGYTREQACASVGPGWAKLINRLFDSKPEETLVIQVKEKFGGLRFYIDSADDEFFTLINLAEDESYKICEDCGAPGSLNTERSWVRTLCKECESKH